MPDFVVVTAFKTKDATSQVIAGLTRRTEKFGRTADKAFRNASKRAGVFGGVLKGILAANALSRGMALAQRGIRSVTEEFIAFDDATTAAAAKFPEKIRRGTEEFKGLAAAAREVGAQTQFTAAQAAEGLDFLAMAGFNAKQAMGALPAVADLATAKNMELGRATDIASDALGAFGLMTKDSAKLTENLTRINDVFTKTTNMVNTDMELLFETIKDGGPAVTLAGQSLETFSALAGAMADSGIKGTKAGTAMKNIFTQLAGATPKVAKALRELKIEVKDSDGNFRDIVDILEEVRVKTEEMGSATRVATIKTIFGKVAFAGATAAINAGAEGLSNYRDKAKAAGGETKRVAEEMRKSLGARLKIIRSTAIEVGFKFIDTFKDKIPGAIDKTINWIRKIDVKNIIDQLSKIWNFFKKVVSVVDSLTPIIIGMTAAWAIYHTLMKMIMVAEGIRFFFKMAKAIRAAAVAQGLLNAAMLANPILAIAVAIGVLVTAVVLLIKHWDELTAVWEKSVRDTEKLIERIAELGATIAGVFAGPGVQKALQMQEATRKQIEAFERTPLEIKMKPVSQTIVPEFEMPGEAERTIFREAITESTRKPPNIGEARRKKEEEEKRKIEFEGKMTFEGAPPGTTFEGKTVGAPPIRTEFLGVNP